MINDHVHDHVILVMLKMLTLFKMKAMVHKKFKETPGPVVAEPVPPLRNVGALVPGIQSNSPSSIFSICKKQSQL